VIKKTKWTAILKETPKTDICKIGKILNKQTDATKLKDYTFAQPIKQVWKVQKNGDKKSDEQTGNIPVASEN
jgi:hypothetical protein